MPSVAYRLLCLDLLLLSFLVLGFNMRFSRYNGGASFRADGDEEIRTLDPLLARQVLSQLSYIPLWFMYSFVLYRFHMVLKSMGLSGLEPPTSRLSGVRSNRLSYKPIFFCNLAATYSPTPSPVQYPRPARP